MVVQKSNNVTVKTLRKRLKMSQIKFAQALYMSRQATVSDWESGRATPDWLKRAKALDRLLKEAGMSWDDLPDDVVG